AGAAVAMVACQGAVGKTGETGPEGPPGPTPPAPPPENLAPQARALTFEARTLREGTDPIAVNVASNFFDPDGDDAALVLSYSVAPPAGVVDVAYEAPNLTITPVDAGEAVITVMVSDGNSSASATLMVTVVDAGDPMPIEGILSEHYTLRFGDRKTISGSEIESAFDGESLTFNAVPDDPTIVDVDMDNPNDPNEVTITAFRKEGKATVTITATDEDGDMASQTIEVEVRESLAPVVSDMMPEPVTLYVGGDPTEPIDVTLYFDDHGLEALNYVADSDNDAVAAAISGSMLTMTPTNMRMEMETVTATVTITATNKHGHVEQMISVTVMATPPTERGTIPAQTIAAGDTRNIALGQYFTPGKGSTPDDLTYEASVEGTAATALISGGDTLVITAGSAAGSATITVTATDGEGEDAMQTVMVTVTVETRPDPPQANMLPKYKMDKTLEGMYPIQIIDTNTNEEGTGLPDSTDNDTRAAVIPETGDTAAAAGDSWDNKSIDLSDYFEDPDGVDSRLIYEVTKTADVPDDKTTSPAPVVLNLHSVAATTSAAASGKPPNGESEDSLIIIEPLNAGTATITVEVTDEDGDTATFTFTVKVVASTSNAPPTLNATPSIQGQTGDVPTADATRDLNKRLGIGEERKVIDSSKATPAASEPLNKFHDYFRDANFNNQLDTHNPNERLEITWKFYPAGTAAGTGGAVPTANELAADKVAVSVSVSPSVWSGGINDRFSLTLTGIKGTDNSSDTDTDNGHMVALIATDSFGKSVAVLFRVEVNNPPVAYGPTAVTMEKDRKTPGGITKFSDLLGTGGEVTYDLDGTDGTDTDPAVFSDVDGDALTCQFRTSEHNVEPLKKLAAVTMNTEDDGTLSTTVDNVLEVDPAGTRIGNMTVMVKCKDTFDKYSPEESIPVHVTRGLSVHS
ncbi:MAG: hypothetical protein OXJ62_00595, partial [Spirochaetaceae bacterium]|nr:hypothetical protein [Spirochaetaceae bacterium]